MSCLSVWGLFSKFQLSFQVPFLFITFSIICCFAASSLLSSVRLHFLCRIIDGDYLL